MINYDTVLLDVDGTLLDFEKYELAALKKSFETHNLDFNDIALSKFKEINISLWKKFELGMIDKHTVLYTRFVNLFRELGINCDGVSFEDEYQEHLSEGCFFINGALELVQALYERCDLYIVTNGVSRTQLKRLKTAGLDKYMTDIFVSESTGYQKPMKEYFDYCFSKINYVDLSKTIIVGDSLSSDIAGGNNAGIRTCWFNPYKLSKNVDVHIDYEITELSKLYDIVFNDSELSHSQLNY